MDEGGGKIDAEVADAEISFSIHSHQGEVVVNYQGNGIIITYSFPPDYAAEFGKELIEVAKRAKAHPED